MSLLKPTLFLFVLVGLLFVTSKTADAQTSPYVTIISPNGGETYTVGDSVRISWETNANVQCSIYYVTPEGGTSNVYYVGSASSSAQFFDWNASKPSDQIENQLIKIQMACIGVPVEYSDDYFTVSAPLTPVCDRVPQITYTNTA